MDYESCVETREREETERAIEKLKLWQPKSLTVHCADGELHPVAIPERRRKWVTVAQTLEGLCWRRIDAKDKQGATVGVITCDLGELEEIPISPKVSEVSGLLGLMLKAQDVALKRDHERLQALINQQTKLVEIVVKRLVSLETKHMELIEFAASLGGDGDGSTSGKVLEDVLPALKGLAMLRGSSGKKTTD